MATKSFNRVHMTTATAGTGTITLGAAAAANVLTFAEAGAQDGDEVNYVLEDGADFEIGTGVLGDDVSTLTRATVHLSKAGSTIGTAKIDLSGAARLRSVESAEFFNSGAGNVRYDQVQTLSPADQARSRANISAAKASTVAAKSANYTVASADDGAAIMVDADAAAVTITLPPAASVGGGFRVVAKKTDGSANTVTIDGDASETIDGALTKVLRLQGQSVALICDGAGWQVMGEGTVFESGDNANGNYVRFADGTQICWGTVSITPTANTPTDGIWTFPAAFISAPEACATTYAASTVLTRPAMLSDITTTTSMTINILRTNTTPTNNSVMATGRWF